MGLSAWVAAKPEVALEKPVIHVRLFADADDDDANGEADGLQVGVGSTQELLTLEEPRARNTTVQKLSGDAVRVIAGGKPLDVRRPRALDKLQLQGLRPGQASLELAKVVVDSSVIAIVAFDQAGQKVDLATSHASISRSLPEALQSSQAPRVNDPDALRWVVIGPPGSLPGELEFVSTRPDGSVLDNLPSMPIESTACPSGTAANLECKGSPFVRATSDLVDRTHPGAFGRSIRAEVGGRIIVRAEGKKAAAIRVGGPRQTAIGPLERYRAKLRVRILRMGPGGAPAIGGNERAAIALANEEIRTANGLWGQCGIHFGYGAQLDIQVVDPPPAHLLAIGCDLGLPASGGELRFRANGRKFRVPTERAQSPTEVAGVVANTLRAAGLNATVSANTRIAPGALRTVDVLVRAQDGTFVELAPDEGESGQLSSDPTLNVCLGEVDLADGLTHFTDYDAIAGTLEERSLIKAFDDADPSTIEVFIIPNFALSGRIGESFIHADGGSVRNAVIIDRAGIRAGSRSFALAHELGHILLDMPGHPDDFGVDSSTSLMDADAADPTIFGPRRLTVDECERAVVQSGPKAPIALLESWPLYDAAPRALTKNSAVTPPRSAPK